ncbi:MAG: lipopolysaccharide heptosyltransferase II [Verrucomicrobiota bacterium]
MYGKFVSGDAAPHIMSVSFHPPPRRILVRGVNWLGDAVMTTPALARLREKNPGAQITLLTPAKLCDLWGDHPAVDEVIGFEPGAGLFSVGRKLRAGRFDLALVLPNSPRSAMEVWLAGIPQRIGYAQPWRNWFLTRAVPPRPGHVTMRKRMPEEIRRLVNHSAAQAGRPNSGPASAHQIYEYLELAGTVGASIALMAPSLRLKDAELAAAASQFELDPQTKWLGINAGAEYGPAKRWPAERFLFVAREAAAWPGWGVMLFGGKSDLAMVDKIERDFWAVARHWAVRPKLVNLAGRTSLRELMALLKICRGLLTNDTGPMHVAAALGTPVVVPFGSTSPELTGPGLPGDPRHRLLKSDAPCSPCFLRDCPIDFRCLKGIGSDRVVAAVLEAIHQE